MKMKPPRYRLIFALAAAMVASPGIALVVYNYSATVNERFDSGFPGTPVPNASGSFLGAGLDFSGVGWLTGSSQFSLTMISPQHFVIAEHTKPANGASVSFLNQAGVVKTYTVDSTSVITHSAGVNTDLAIGRLTAPIAGADLVTSYPILLFNTYGEYANLPLLVYGQSGRIGQNTLDAIYLNADMLPFGSGNAVADSTLFSADYDAATNQSQGEGGDSGSPTFYVAGATLALLGVHSAIDTTPAEDLTYDSFVPTYTAQINALLTLDSYSLQAIPEPSTVTAWLGAAALVLTLRRRSCRWRRRGRAS